MINAFRLIVSTAMVGTLTFRDTIASAAAAELELPSRLLSEIRAGHDDPWDAEGFWAEVEVLAAAGKYPFVEEMPTPHAAPDDYVRVTFLHRMGTDEPDNVLLFANVNHVLAQELLFERIAGTDVYYKSVDVPGGVRFEYRILENDPLTGIFAGAKYGTRMHLLGDDPDPLNPTRTTYADGLGDGVDYVETWVELPGASPQPYFGEQGHPRGTLTATERESALLGYSRRILCYTPPEYDSSQAYPLLLLFDASDYFRYGGLQRTLENLFAAGAIPPLVVLGLDAGVEDGISRRNDEFTCGTEFMECLATEIIPWFASAYGVTSDPHRRVIAGSSFGGLFATYFAFHHPEIVGNVLSQSGSFHWGRTGDAVPFEWLVREFAFSDKRPLCIYMEVGKLEGEYTWTNPFFPHQVVSHRHFKTILDLKGYEVTYVEYGGGHEMLSWRGGIADGLIHLFHGGGAGGK